MEVAIFCKVIDNFGDAGFCLRLARGLSEKVNTIRVFCDDIILLNKLYIPKKHDKYSMPKNLIMCSYDYEFQLEEISSLGMVVEAFHAEPPVDYLKKIEILGGVTRVILDHLVTDIRLDPFQNKRAPDYKLLEYLDVSTWKTSSAANRIWMAPGFTPMSAGLVFDGWKKINSDVRTEFRNRILISNETKIRSNNCTNLGQVFIICVFLYEMNDFLLQLPIPEGFDSIALWEPKSIVMNQLEFDCALQSCDFNYVRGEDSFLSAHNAAASEWKVPFVWQPYLEKNEGHIKKFEGWKKMFPGNKFHSYWDFAMAVAARENLDLEKKWENLIKDWNLFNINFHTTCLKITKQKSLEQSLLNCIENNLR